MIEDFKKICDKLGYMIVLVSILNGFDINIDNEKKWNFFTRNLIKTLLIKSGKCI